MSKFWKRILLFPLAIIMGVDGGDPPAPADPPANDPPPADPPAGDPPPPADPPDDDPAAKLYGAPDKYELTVPEGTQNPDGFLDAFSGVVKKYNLSQEGAQSLLNDLATDIQPKMVAARQAEWDGVVAGWETAAKADTEIGGAKYDEVKTQALRARNTFSTPELDAFLTQYRIDGHPEVTRLFYRLSQSMREDSVIKPDAGVSQNDERINNFYSTMKK